MTNRQQYDEALADLRAEVAAGRTVEILSGPCAPMVIRTNADVRAYGMRLWRWLMEGR